VLLDEEDLARVIYVDHYGSCMTGIRAKGLSRDARLFVGSRVLRFARTFEEAPAAFWYEKQHRTRRSLGRARKCSPRPRLARWPGDQDRGVAVAAAPLRLEIGDRIVVEVD
jgi:hypothetical protein